MSDNMPENEGQRRGWLLTLNPPDFGNGYDKWCNGTKDGSVCRQNWRCSNTHPQLGDDVFVMRTGKQPRGIVAHGYVCRESFYDKAGKRRIDVEFDRIQDFDSGYDFLPQNKLKMEFPQQDWSPKASGIEIRQEVLGKLREQWQAMLDNEFWPPEAEYNPGISSEEYADIFRTLEANKLDTLYYLYKMGGIGSCKQLEEKYGNTASHYNSNAIRICKVVQDETGCDLYARQRKRKNGELAYWPILFQGRDAMENESGKFVYKLRQPVRDAIILLDKENFFEEIKIMNQSEYDKNIILYGPPGTGKTYKTAAYAVAICDGEAVKDLANYDDVMKRYNELKAEGRVEFITFHQSYGYEDFIEGIRPVMDEGGNELSYKVVPGIFKRFCSEASKSEVAANNFGIAKDASIWKATIRDNVLQDCYENNYVRIDWGMEAKGASGFVNEINIGDIILTTDKSRTYIHGIAVVTSEAYKKEGVDEDTTTRNVEWLVKGLHEDITSINAGKMLSRMTCARVPNVKVKDLIDMAKDRNSGLSDVVAKDNTKPYVFIIDEINRGNISKIFGELITLLEDTKRAGMKEALSVSLPYSDESFSVPANVYIVGTMNTADRSIAMMDTALRRRFRFIEMLPEPKILEGIKVGNIDIPAVLKTINKRITYLFDREHTIGHAFFTGLRGDNATIENLGRIFEKSIIPLLQEYFYEDYHKIQLVLGDNAKSSDKYKFIIADEFKKDDNVFRGNVDDLDIPDKIYRINKNAFSNENSYLEIIEAVE